VELAGRHVAAVHHCDQVGPWFRQGLIRRVRRVEQDLDGEAVQRVAVQYPLNLLQPCLPVAGNEGHGQLAGLAGFGIRDDLVLGPIRPRATIGGLELADAIAARGLLHVAISSDDVPLLNSAEDRRSFRAIRCHPGGACHPQRRPASS